MNSTSLRRKRVRRQQTRSAVAQIAARLRSLFARRQLQNLIPLEPFNDV